MKKQKVVIIVVAIVIKMTKIINMQMKKNEEIIQKNNEYF